MLQRQHIATSRPAPTSLTPPPPLTTPTERLLASPSVKPAGPTFPPPPSAIAARVAAFLPTLAAANDALAADVAAGRGDAHNVECVDEGQPHVEMDVAAGVLELGDDAAVRAAEAAVARGGGDNGLAAGGASSAETSSDSETESDEEGVEGVRKKRRAPGITVLD